MIPKRTKRRDWPAKKAYEAGILQRLLALGFEEARRDVYVREDERFREYALLELNSETMFADIHTIFDKDLDALFQQAFPGQGWRSAGINHGPGGICDAHVDLYSTTAWHEAEEEHIARWRARHPWYLPWNWRKTPPENLNKKSPFNPYVNQWSTEPGPGMCVDLSLWAWDRYVAPWRERMRTDKRALVAEYLRKANGGGAFKEIVCHVYLGDQAEAERVCREILIEEGQPPTKRELKRRRRYFEVRDMDPEEFIRDRIDASYQAADRVRAMAPRLGLDPSRG